MVTDFLGRSYDRGPVTGVHGEVFGLSGAMNLQRLFNLPHQHLLLNHLPIIGSFIGLGLLLAALTTGKDDLKKASLVIFSLIALFAIPAYTSGHAALAVIQKEPDLSQAAVDAHQGAALIAFILIEITGAFAWLALWQFRRVSRPARWVLPAVLFCSLLTAGLLVITGNTGGEIRHSEIRAGEESIPFVATIGNALFSSTQRVVLITGRWGGMWPVLETLHFFGLTLLFGTLGFVDLRIIGLFKRLPLDGMLRFVPWAIAGFALNIITGFLFFIGMPPFYVFNIDFHLKMLSVVPAGANVLLLFFTDAFRSCDQLGPGEEAPSFAKIFAVTSILLVVLLIVLGRYMPFFEDTLTPSN
jgi:uncharacterized membrane protein